MRTPGTGAGTGTAPSTGRLVGLDVARTLALLGMICAHTVDSLDVDAPGGVDPLFQLVSGRSAALFAVLAGLSIALVTREAPTTRDRRQVTAYRWQVLVRAALIALLGLVLGLAQSGLAVILTYYGLLFLAAVPVLRWRARSLALLAAGWALAGPAVSMVLRPVLPEPTLAVPSPVSLADPVQLLSELAVTGYYPVLTWCSYLFVGMAIGRSDLRSPRLTRALLVGGTLLAAAALGVSALLTRSPTVRADLVSSSGEELGVTSWGELDTVLREGLFGTHPTESWWWLGLWAPHTGSIVDLVHTSATAVAVIGGCLWVVARLPARRRRVTQVLFGAGTMTLTLYSLHVTVVAASAGAPVAAGTAVNVLLVLAVGAVFAGARVRGPLETWVSATARAAADLVLDRPPRG